MLGGLSGGFRDLITLEEMPGGIGRFEQDVQEALGDRIRASKENGSEFWSALANVKWHHESGDEASYSFRAAGDLIAAIRKEGDYLDWYRSGPYGQVADWIEEAMASKGWKFELR